LVPVIAPALGKLILDVYGWEGIFYIQLILSAIVAFWFSKRQAETLKEENKISMSIHNFTDGIKEVVKYKMTIGFTIISGFVTGSFMVYLSSSEQIFREQYNMEEQFPYIFAGLAITIGTAIFLNGSFVLKYGMRKLVSYALFSYFLISVIYVTIFAKAENPSVIVLIIFFGIQFFSLGFIFGNIRALTMQPVGHIAGMAAALTGFVSTLMAVGISTFIGRYIDTTALPLFLGFSVCSGISLLILWALRRTQ